MANLHWTIYKENNDGQVTCMHGLNLAVDTQSGDYTYKLYDAFSWWICERVPITIGPLSMAAVSRHAGSLDAAREWADADWSEVQQLQEWVSYMVNNPPPGQ